MELKLTHEAEVPKKTAELKRVQVRFRILTALFFLQWLGIRQCFSTHFMKKVGFLWSDLLVVFAHNNVLPALTAGFLIAFMLAASEGWRVFLGGLQSAGLGHRWRGLLVGQISIFVLLFGLTYLLSRYPGQLENYGAIIAGTWSLLIMAAACLAMLVLAPPHYWRSVAKQEKRTLLFAAFCGSTAAATLSLTQYAWVWEPLRVATFEVVKIFLSLFYPDVVSDPGNYILGTPTFRIRLASPCSGYVGMGIVVLFLSSYLIAFRREFRFPQVLVFLPIGAAAIWLLNVFRIVLLITIGTSLSRDIALGGFHSRAGWIAVIAVSLTLVVLAHRWFGALPNTKPQPEKAASSNNTYALLLPIVVLFSTTLLTGVLTATFDWLYPLRVATTGVVLAFFWKQYDLRVDRHILEPLGIGTLVFLAWLLLVPTSSDANREFAYNLAQASTPAATLWLLFRIAGTTVVIPLTEEFAFRGYLLGKLAGAKTDLFGTIPFSWTAIVVSSAAFGALHGNWHAGFVAGAAYAFARYRRGHISDAIFAHISTNSLLAIYVLTTGEWSYWSGSAK